MKKRNYTIDFARLLFIFGILLNHTTQLASPGENIAVIMRCGYLGVEFFFIVSGWLMMKKAAVDNGQNLGLSTKKYLLGKIGALYPYFFLSIFFIFSFAQFFEKSSILLIVIRAVRSIPMLLHLDLAGFDGYQLNGSVWYLSAMYLALLILYPLAVKFKTSFLNIIAPMICIGLYGHIIRLNGSLAITGFMQGAVISGGVLRAFAGISLGSICYAVSNKLASFQFTSFGKLLLSLVEISMYVLAFMLMRTQYYYQPDQTIVTLFAIAVTISFSDQSYTGRVFVGNPTWMGKLAACIYLADSPARYLIMQLTPELNRDDRIFPALSATLVLALVIWYLGEFLRITTKKIRLELHQLLFN